MNGRYLSDEEFLNARDRNTGETFREYMMRHGWTKEQRDNAVRLNQTWGPKWDAAMKKRGPTAEPS